MATGDKRISMKKLPVGYKLNPSDEDLVNHHLKRKLRNIPEEYCLIPEFDIYKLPPWDLISKFSDLSDLASDGVDCFFFYRWINPNAKRKNRRTKEGFWKVTGKGRKPRDTDRTKWLKRILVFHVGKQKSAVKSDWAMHEWENISDPSIVVCRIVKIKSKKRKVKVNSVSSEACSNHSPGATACSVQIEPQETSLEASVNTIMESQNLTPTSYASVLEFSTSSPPQTQMVTEERLYLSEDTYTDTIKLADLDDLPDDLIPTREHSPCSENASITGCDQRDSSSSHSGDVTLEEGVNMSTFFKTPTDQSLNDVLPGFVSPPQQPCMMPTEKIAPPIGNTSFSCSGSGSNMIYPQLDIPGHGALLSFASMKCGAQETNFQEALQSPNPTLAMEHSPCYENMFAPGCDQEDVLWLYHEDLSPWDDGDTIMFHQTPSDQLPTNVLLGSVDPHQQQQMMPMEDIPFSLVPPEFHIESPAAIQSSDLDIPLDSFFAYSPPYASGDALEKCNPEMP